MARTILCFGDSNTYGTNPAGGRFDETVRWPGAIKTLLGDRYRIIEEGLPGRTFVYDDPAEGGYKSGVSYLPACALSHNPIDLFIVMLGTNDAKGRFALSAQAMGSCLITLIRTCRFYAVDASGAASKILVVAPPPIGKGILETPHGGIFGARSQEVTREAAHVMHRTARLMRCEFLDAADFCETSLADCVHLTKQGHLALAHGIAQKIRTIFGEEIEHA